MTKKAYILTVIFFLGFCCGFSQNSKINTETYSIELQIVGKETNAAIKDADVQVEGRYFRHDNVRNYYLIKAEIGDQLVVSHPDFETVYHTVKSRDEINIVVTGVNIAKKRKTISKYDEKNLESYQQNLDSAKYYKKSNIVKSLSFLENNLKATKNVRRNATNYAVLGDVYFYWKQYDLAIGNYETSLKLEDKTIIQIRLANAYYLHGDYDASKNSYIDLLLGKLSEFESILAYQGIGDVYFKKKKYVEAKINYNRALKKAVKNEINAKITDLNSALAGVYAEEGNIPKAKKYFKNALQLADKENTSRTLLEQEKVANFFNSNNLYDDEIELRKESLTKVLSTDTIKKKELDYYQANLTSIFSNWFSSEFKESKFSSSNMPITPQSVNYKIGRAYVQKEAYNEAIPFLKNSISASSLKNDLIVKKDATRKLSEVYANVGEYTKAFKTYQDYVKIVDTLYIKKQQEIAQVKRFNKKISENQNRISSLEKDRELTESKMNIAYKDKQLTEEINKRQLNLIYTLIAGILLLVLLAYLQVRSSRQQKIANNLLALKSMRSQMNPHFIFNALNSVNSFIAMNDERNANRYLSEFSVLMRTVLENSDEDFIPLTKEIELIELYVKLEHNRFKDKFVYHVFIDSNIDLEKFNIPPMLLQPYIENAIWHGLRYKEEMGELLISMEVYDHETIRIVIQDDGIGRKKSKELKTENQLKRKSKGMITIKNRIAILNDMYKEKITVNVTDVFENAEGTKVELLLKRI